jgi:hypothetical protein
VEESSRFELSLNGLPHPPLVGSEKSVVPEGSQPNKIVANVSNPIIAKTVASRPVPISLFPFNMIFFSFKNVWAYILMDASTVKSVMGFWVTELEINK